MILSQGEDFDVIYAIWTDENLNDILNKCMLPSPPPPKIWLD